MKKRLTNILIGLDQFCQVLVYIGAYCPDETISGIIGRKIKTNKANIVEKVICWFLRKIQSKHCIKNIDEQESMNGESF